MRVISFIGALILASAFALAISCERFLVAAVLAVVLIVVWVVTYRLALQSYAIRDWEPKDVAYPFTYGVAIIASAGVFYWLKDIVTWTAVVFGILGYYGVFRVLRWTDAETRARAPKTFSRHHGVFISGDPPDESKNVWVSAIVGLVIVIVVAFFVPDLIGGSMDGTAPVEKLFRAIVDGILSLCP